MRPLIASLAILLLSFSQPAFAQSNAFSPARMIKPQPVTIRGKALNQQGQPVAGATIGVLSTNRIRPSELDTLLAQSTTDATGAYILRDVPLPILGPDGGPIKTYSEGSFQIFGTAAGYGFTWHPDQSVRLDQRPANSNTGPNQFYLGEECVADLVFDLPATIQGQLTNDRGEPLAGVKVEFGYFQDLRRPNGLASSRCAYLGPPEAPGDPLKDNFQGMDRLPKEVCLAVTDREGRYKLTGLRRETSYGILIDYRSNADPLELSVATTIAGKGHVDRRLGYDGRLDHTFVIPPTLTVQITASGGASLPDVTVRAKRRQLLRGGNLAKSDANGKALLHLPADSYTLYIEPPISAPHLPREIELAVTAEPRDQTTTLTLEPAATVVLSAIDAQTQQPLAGVSFLRESGAASDRQPLHSQSVLADYPETDDQGALRAILPPGRLRFIVDTPPTGYEPVRAASDLLTLAAGLSQTVRFEFRKTATAETAAPQDELSPLRDLLAKQRSLPRSGTYRIRQATVSSFRTPIPIGPAELRKLVDGWNPSAGPDFFEVLRKAVPPESFGESRTIVVTHGQKQRNETESDSAGLGRRTNISVSNGHENIRFDPANGQASLSPGIVGTTPQRFGPTPSVFYTLPTIAYARATAAGVPKPQATRRAGKLILEWGSPATSREEIDEATGFLHHHWSQTTSGFGRENWYFSPRRMDSGQVLAGLAIQCQWRDDKFTMLQVVQLEEVTLRTPPSDAFVVSAPAGTIIVDSRERGLQSKVQTVNYPIADVVTFANRIPADQRSILPVLKVGQPAPPLNPLAWLNASGQTPPPDLKGKVLFIDFWGIFCGPCVAELPDVQALAKVFANENFVLIGLHESSVELAEVAEFARQRSLTYQLAIDRPAPNATSFGAAFTAYGVRGIPACAVIDQDGRLAYLGRFDEASRAAAKLLGKDNK